MRYLKVSIFILISLSLSRFIPHPPNFTSLIALSFYLPAFFGRKYIPVILTSFLITDLIIGMHNLTLFTWGSVIIIGLISRYLKKNILFRICGSLSGAIIFFIITNFGVYLSGYYGFGMSSLINCYTMAIPFFNNTIISTLLFSLLFEAFNKTRTLNSFIYNVR